jgi:hypothetical protein
MDERPTFAMQVDISEAVRASLRVTARSNAATATL